MRLVAPWISAIDLKDFHYALSKDNPKMTDKAMVGAGEGVVPWREVGAIVDECGIDPLYIVHFEYDFDQTDLPKTVKTELDTFKHLLVTNG